MRCRGRQNVHQTHVQSLQRRRLVAAGICRPRPREMGTTIGPRLADRPLLWLFRAHLDVLLRLAASARGWRSLHCPRGAAGGFASFSPDRHADVYAALISASGAMAAVLPADLFIQTPRRLSGRALVRLARLRLLTASRRSVAPKSPALAGLASQQLQSG